MITYLTPSSACNHTVQALDSLAASDFLRCSFSKAFQCSFCYNFWRLVGQMLIALSIRHVLFRLFNGSSAFAAFVMFMHNCLVYALVALATATARNSDCD